MIDRRIILLDVCVMLLCTSSVLAQAESHCTLPQGIANWDESHTIASWLRILHCLSIIVYVMDMVSPLHVLT